MLRSSYIGRVVAKLFPLAGQPAQPLFFVSFFGLEFLGYSCDNICLISHSDRLLERLAKSR
ncbi:hypothetical protein [Bartonella sp. AC66GZZY]|uniref:hypothetical protein n=1 Tax=Bartonella sp. AC66GZZY TaxID=3243458 RepID=UPI0035CECC0A